MCLRKLDTIKFASEMPPNFKSRAFFMFSKYLMNFALIKRELTKANVESDLPEGYNQHLVIMDGFESLYPREVSMA